MLIIPMQYYVQNVRDDVIIRICGTRAMHGHCNHLQCMFHPITHHQARCVSLVARKGRKHKYCDQGMNCIDQCKYSFKSEGNQYELLSM